jgi:hypothetical protein
MNTSLIHEQLAISAASQVVPRPKVSLGDTYAAILNTIRSEHSPEDPGLKYLEEYGDTLGYVALINEEAPESKMRQYIDDLPKYRALQVREHFLVIAAFSKNDEAVNTAVNAALGITSFIFNKMGFS